MRLDVYGDTLGALVTATALASTGNQVVLHLLDDGLLAALERGDCPFREPDLHDLLVEQVEEKRLFFSRIDTPPADNSSVVFLALAPNLLSVAEDIVRQIARLPARAWLLINQSTFPVGTTDALRALFYDVAANASDDACQVVSLPDTLQEGAALVSFTRPSNVILGCDSGAAEARVREILRPFNRRRDAILVMRPREAEFTKLAINGMLATRLSFMNEIANLADVFSVDIERVRQGIGADGRVGEAYLYPGCGFGGLSFSRDLMSLADTLASSGVGTALLDQVMAINEHQKEVLFRKLWCHYGRDLTHRTVTLWGASFKPNTHRIDNAPSLRLIDSLLAQGVRVQVHDPQALPEVQQRYAGVEQLVCFDDEYEALADSDALLLVTEWKCYWQPDFARMKTLMRTPLLLDGRNIYGPDSVRGHGFDYYGVGRQ